jgi:hypothetical protein
MDALLQRQRELNAGPRVTRFTSVDFNPFVEGTDAWRFHQERIDKQNAVERTHADLERDLRQFIEELCDIYLSTDAETAEEIRQLVATRECFHLEVKAYQLTAPDQITGPSDVQQFRRGLAALSIEDDFYDWRDTISTIELLYFAAQEAGIDPRPHFAEVATKSSQVNGHSSYTPLGKTLEQVANSGIEHYRSDKSDLDRIRLRIRQARQSTK